MYNFQEEEKKPIDQEDRIAFKVTSQDKDEVFFKIRKNTQLKKVMYVYCDRRAVKLDAFAFFFNGIRLRCNQTLDELGMEDGDKIYAARTMSGGLRANQLQWSYMVFDHNRL